MFRWQQSKTAMTVKSILILVLFAGIAEKSSYFRQNLKSIMIGKDGVPLKDVNAVVSIETLSF